MLRVRTKTVVAVLAAAVLGLVAPPVFGQEPVSIETACPPDRTPPTFFYDVDDNPHAGGIDCIVWYGISEGTGDATYSPRAGVRRDQMASFLVRLASALDVEMPSGDAQFDDTADNVHQEAINRLATAGITEGRGDRAYGPRDTVRRDQMATFLVRTYEFLTDEELSASERHFSDTDGNPHEPNIDAAAEAGLTAGMAGDRFGPARDVHRDQMASFLARVLSLARPRVPGGRDNPHPMGDVVRLEDDWEVEVLDSEPDATERVLDENQFNEPPEEGHQFFIARVRATYRGEGSDRFGPSRLYAWGGSSTYTQFGDSCGVIPHDLGDNEQSEGGSVEGNICWEVPADAAEDLRMFDDKADYRHRRFMGLLPE